MAKVWTVAIGVALTAALAACGEGDSGAPTAEPTTPTPPATAGPSPSPTHEVIDGVPVVPMEIASEAEFPDDIALIIEMGCTQCDGPTEGLVRVYRDPAGQVRTDTLFTLQIAGLSPRQVTTPAGAETDYPRITSFALNRDASEIVIAVCSRSRFDLPGGLWPACAQTTLFRSLDGGVTWAEFSVLDGEYFVVAIAAGGVVLGGTVTSEEEAKPRLQLFPSGDAVEPPPQAAGTGPFVLPGGELLWATADGRLLRTDGSQFLALTEGVAAYLPGGNLRPAPGGQRFPLVIWVERPAEYSGDYYLGVFDLEGRLLKAFSSEGFASIGGWLGSGLAVGNAVVTAEQLTTTPPEPFVGTLPALFDLDVGRANPMPDPFLDPPFLNGRNHILAVLPGPFARVAGSGGCLNVRAEPGTDSAVLDCAADGVLLRGLEDTIIEGGVTWVHVVTPAGADGWASGDYLER